MTTLLWFKRDLRIADHPALGRALQYGEPILPLYVVEPDLWAQPDMSARQYRFAMESVEALRGALRDVGADLVVRVGEMPDTLAALRAEHPFGRIVSHEETGNGWTYARDKRVAAWCRAEGVDWEELPQSGVERRSVGRDGWAKRRNAFVFDEALPTPERIEAVRLPSDAPPSVEALGLGYEAPERQRGGRPMALSLLGGFLTERGRTYRSAMSSPLEGEWACSRLSPHLAFGTLSGREAVRATAARQREVKGTRDGWGGSLSSFQSRLAWRDHFTQKLEDEPRIEVENMHRAYDAIRTGCVDTQRLDAFRNAETGVPFVDACLRFLSATGWINFRMRAMLQSFASYHLWLHWREPGLHTAKLYTDYEAGIHWSQTQMQSGTTGINTARIYNPVKQGRDQDPKGVFTRAWLPELHKVPDEHLQEPWAWEGKVNYPPPIVDVAEAAREARSKIGAVRRGGAHRSEAAGIVEKHGSRNGPRTRNDRSPRKQVAPKTKAKDDAQTSMDL